METTKKTYYIDGLRVTLRHRSYRSDGPQGMASKVRVYSSEEIIGLTWRDWPTEPRCTDLECGSGQCCYARQTDKPENCEVDHKVWNAFKRSTEKLVVARMRPTLAEVLHWPAEDVKLRWSRTAGCNCGCSPAWILEEPRMNGFDLSVDMAPFMHGAGLYALALGLSYVAAYQHSVVRV